MRYVKGICLLLFCLLLLTGCQPASEEGLAVTVLDVGQSDCTLVVQSDRVLMIDSGTSTAREAVQYALHSRGIRKIDYLLLTHPHEDHIGNARMLIEKYEIGALILSPAVSEDWGYELVLQAAEGRGIPVTYATAGYGFSVGAATAEVLAVFADAKDINDAGVILRVQYGETSFLFTGDGEGEAERRLLEGVPPEKLDCDFYKAGHHGSDTSSSAALLEVVTPSHAAISCGEHNDYGFPHRELMERLAAVGAAVHRTDLEGDLHYVSDGSTVAFQEK